MRKETRALLSDMGDWAWFERVGEPIDDPAIISVGSWDGAVEPRRNHVWECLRLQVFNVSFNAVSRLDWHRAQRWNPIVDEVKQALNPLFGRIGTLGTRLSLPEMSFYHQVTWDLVLSCMETEYADISPPLFNVPVLAPWYLAGHFPCGWDGPELDTDWDGTFPPYHLYVF